MVKQKTISKKVFALKLILIVLIGLILGSSCFFSAKIESALGIGSGVKSTYYADKSKVVVDDLTIHYLDVGQGDCTFIVLPDKTTIMIDASLSSKADRIIEYVRDLGFSQIDHFILTHSDKDHCGGAKKIFDAFEIKNIYRPFEIAMEKGENSVPYANEPLGSFYINHSSEKFSLVSTDVYRNFIDAIYSETYTDDGGVELQSRVTVSHDELLIPANHTNVNFSFEFFAPLIRSNIEFDYSETHTYGYPTEIYDKDKDGHKLKDGEIKNSCSGVMLMEYKNKSFLFTGDATETVEDKVIKSLSNLEKERFKNIDVFQAGHHGAATSNSEDFLELIKPTYVVVSCGLNNKYDHPSQAFLERLANLPHSVNDYLLRTDIIGNIVFGFTDDDGLVYYATQAGEGIMKNVYWWEVALSLFVVSTVIIISIKFTKNVPETVKKVANKVKKYK